MNTISNDRILELYKQAEKSVVFLSNSKESKQQIMLQNFAKLIANESKQQWVDLDEDEIEHFVDQYYNDQILLVDDLIKEVQQLLKEKNT